MTNIDDLIALLERYAGPAREDLKLRAAAALREQQAEIARLIDACNGMIGLIQLIASRVDLPTGLDDVMLLNHRVTEAIAAIDAAMKEKP